MTIIVILVLFVSALGTYFIRKIALYNRILDIPNMRSSHTEPTPRGGGLAIVISWFLGISFLHLFELIESELFFALISGAFLAIISFLDDLYTIKPWIRILFQLVTVFAGLYFLGGFKLLYFDNLKIEIPLYVNILIIIGGIWFINLYNFLDGIDGYASVEAISIAIGCYIITQDRILFYYFINNWFPIMELAQS
ncbi:MAG: hypothetical protein IPN68_08570 [Bacteroidetes bacterium]|nr:hypothetical protein [Bacteroidota bacterium]